MQVSQLLNDNPGAGPSVDSWARVRDRLGQPTAPAGLDPWLGQVRQRVTDVLAAFVSERCAEYVHGVPGARFLAGLLGEFAAGGKYVRSTFTYLGWLSGAAEDDAALRAAASTELVHAFALLQDDVMDGSALRRGRPAAHLRLAAWHRAQGLNGPAGHFGESAAILLADLCLVWAEQLLRQSGLDAAALARGWPRYDTLRGELAVGQFADLVNDARSRPTLDEVLDVTRRKSGNYTVRRPLELGAALAGCDERTLAVLGEYGELVGEAFQLRDDVLGVFGRPSVTGKPSGDDLRERKATSVVVVANQLATSSQEAELSRLSRRETLDDADVDRWRQLIAETGARIRIEQMISRRVSAACDRLAASGLNDFVLGALRDLAVRYTGRVR
ncbi:MAG TPA: polyprenyl synthetase family protein [Streptosporangiaceae bacterium]